MWKLSNNVQFTATRCLFSVFCRLRDASELLPSLRDKEVAAVPLRSLVLTKLRKKVDFVVRLNLVKPQFALTALQMTKSKYLLFTPHCLVRKLCRFLVSISGNVSRLWNAMRFKNLWHFTCNSALVENDNFIMI